MPRLQRPRFGSEFKALLKCRNLTQEEMAEELQASQSAISNWANGYPPSLEKVERLVEVYGLDPGHWLPLAGYAVEEPETPKRTQFEYRVVDCGSTPESMQQTLSQHGEEGFRFREQVSVSVGQTSEDSIKIWVLMEREC